MWRTMQAEPSTSVPYVAHDAVKVLKDMHEPSALKHLLNKEIEAFQQQHKLHQEHPCHNQALERHIKLVSEASTAVAGFKNRDGLIRQKIRSRKLMKTFNIKKQFNA